MLFSIFMLKNVQIQYSVGMYGIIFNSAYNRTHTNSIQRRKVKAFLTKIKKFQSPKKLKNKSNFPIISKK